jgi:hypothetical protein
MHLADSQFNEAALRELGIEASSLLHASNFEGLASRFGYALAREREPAQALEEDIRALFGPESALTHVSSRSVTVNFLEPNDIGLLAEVTVQTGFGERALAALDLVVAAGPGGKRLFLEQVRAG